MDIALRLAFERIFVKELVSLASAKRASFHNVMLDAQIEIEHLRDALRYCLEDGATSDRCRDHIRNTLGNG